MVEGDGFEPSKSLTTDLQSAPFGHSGTPPQKLIIKKWSRLWDSNPQPADYKSAALPIELNRLVNSDYYTKISFSCQQISAKSFNIFNTKYYFKMPNITALFIALTTLIIRYMMKPVEKK